RTEAGLNARPVHLFDGRLRRVIAQRFPALPSHFRSFLCKTGRNEMMVKIESSRIGLRLHRSSPGNEGAGTESCKAGQKVTSCGIVGRRHWNSPCGYAAVTHFTSFARSLIEFFATL